MTSLNMAAVEATADKMIQKNSKILVSVEEALSDLIVVSYCNDDKKFQGVLLDSSKGNLPFGVYSLHPAFTKQAVPADGTDNLHSVSQRFTYQEPQYRSETSQKPKKPGPKAKPQQKMTVRLRPRKVLCSNCQGICNENNENVDVSQKRKLNFDDDTGREAESSQVETQYLAGSMLIPKLSRLGPNEISSAVKSSSKSTNKIMKTEKSVCNETATQEMAFVSVTEDHEDKQHLKDSDVSFGSMFSNARTLKICFGEGEGTVVKIPPLAGDFNEDSGVSCDMGKSDSKAAKKALKKAKKQAKKVSSVKLQRTRQSPKHVGALSPHNNASHSPLVDPLEKKQKHKVKHKKKYKTQKNFDENTSKYSESESVDYFSDIKGQCMKQKLSISLHRLSDNSCEKQSDNETDSGSEEWDSETAPNFPPKGCDSSGGSLLRVSPGDVIWGKVTGFPWWPGRVISVTSTRAHVAWYCSSKTSLMPCGSLSPFLEDYKIHFSKKRQGLYKDAVKQAMEDANRNESHVTDPLASPTHTLTGLSPRPIDVFS